MNLPGTKPKSDEKEEEEKKRRYKNEISKKKPNIYYEREKE